MILKMRQKNLLRNRKPPSADMKRLSRNIRIIINQMNLNDCPRYSKAVVFICVITQIPIRYHPNLALIPINVQ